MEFLENLVQSEQVQFDNKFSWRLEDFEQWKLKGCPLKHRRVIAMFYGNWMHDYFCCKDGSFKWK